MDSQQPAYEPPELERPATAAPTEDNLEHEVPGAVQSRRDPYLALRFRDYRLYAIGGVVGTISGQMQSVAVSYEIYERVRATEGVAQGVFALGIVGLVQAIPVIALMLLTGQVADRVSRRTIVLCCAVVLALSSLGLALASARQAPIIWMYGALLLAGFARAFEGPARQAFISQLVPDEALANAVTWNSSRFQLASMVGPAMGGFIIAAFGSATPVFWIDTVALLVNAGFVAMVRGRPQTIVREAVTLETVLAGWRFVRQTPLILATITLDMCAVFLGGATTLLPAYARDILHVDATGLGWLRAAPAVGALMMAGTIAYLPPMRRAGRNLLWAVAGFGVATIVFGLSRNFWLSLAALVSIGALDNISVVVRHTLVQVLTPDAMRGRVSAINSVFIGTSNELGGFESGYVASLFGPIVSVVSGGIGTIVTVAAIAWIWPSVRELDTLESAAAHGNGSDLRDEVGAQVV
ncbi:MAG: hypothetical protein JWN98_685 [Abditibacteriota bacterium]|nr:hypothetical protein [Abditibacteriota bacterium]